MAFSRNVELGRTKFIMIAGFNSVIDDAQPTGAHGSSCRWSSGYMSLRCEIYCRTDCAVSSWRSAQRIVSGASRICPRE